MSDIFDTLEAPASTRGRDIFDELPADVILTTPERPARSPEERTLMNMAGRRVLASTLPPYVPPEPPSYEPETPATPQFPRPEPANFEPDLSAYPVPRPEPPGFEPDTGPYPMPKPTPGPVAPVAPIPSDEDVAAQAWMKQREIMARMGPAGITPTIKGGPPVSLSPLRTMIPLAEEAGEIADVTLRSGEGLPFPSIVPDVKPDDSFLTGLAKGAGKAALGIPQFMTTPVGVYTMMLGPVAPRLVAGFFAADTLVSLRKELPEVVDRWDEMSSGQQGETLASIIFAAALGIGLTKSAISFKGPTGRPNPAQRYTVKVLAELAETDPKAFGGLLKEQMSKQVDPKYRQKAMTEAARTAAMAGAAQEASRLPGVTPDAARALPSATAEAMKSAGEAVRATRTQIETAAARPEVAGMGLSEGVTRALLAADERLRTAGVTIDTVMEEGRSRQIPVKDFRKDAAFEQLRQEGVTASDAMLLLDGKKTVREVVAGNFKVTPSFVAIPGGQGPRGHAEAFEEGFNNAIARLDDIVGKYQNEPIQPVKPLTAIAEPPGIQPPVVTPPVYPTPAPRPPVPPPTPPVAPPAPPPAVGVVMTPTLEIAGKRYQGKSHADAFFAAMMDSLDGKIPEAEFHAAELAENEGKLPHMFATSDGRLLDRDQAAALLESQYPGVKVPPGGLHSQFLYDVYEKKGQPHAIPEQAPNAIPVQPAPGSSGKVGQEVRPPEAPSGKEGEVPTQEGLKPDFQPPRPPEPIPTGIPKEQVAEAFDRQIKAEDAYRKAVDEWEKTLPKNERLIFDAPNHINVITPEIGGNGWRITWISKKEQYATGHDGFRTRAEAIRKASLDGPRIEKIPFEVKPNPPVEKPTSPAPPTTFEGAPKIDQVIEHPDLGPVMIADVGENYVRFQILNGPKKGTFVTHNRQRWLEDMSVSEKPAPLSYKKQIEQTGVGTRPDGSSVKVIPSDTAEGKFSVQETIEGRRSVISDGLSMKEAREAAINVLNEPAGELAKRATRAPVTDAEISKAAEKWISVEVPDLGQAKERIKAHDLTAQGLRDEYKTLQNEYQAIGSRIITGSRWNKRIKKAAKKADVTRYHELEKRMSEIDSTLRVMDNSIRADRLKFDAVTYAKGVNDTSLPLIQRIGARINLFAHEGQEAPPELVQLMRQLAEKEILQRYPDASKTELDDAFRAVEGAARMRSDLNHEFELNPALKISERRGKTLADEIGRSGGVENMSEGLRKDLERFTGLNPEKLSGKDLETLTARIKADRESFLERKRLEEEAAARATAEAEAAAKAEEARLLDEAQSVVDSQSRKRDAQEIKDDLLSRIEKAMDDLIAKSNVRLTKGSKIDYTIEGETIYARAEVTRDGDKYKVKVTPSQGDGVTHSFETMPEAERFMKSFGATGLGKTVIAVPGDGIFKIHNHGPTLAHLWKRIKSSLQTGSGESGEATVPSTKGSKPPALEKKPDRNAIPGMLRKLATRDDRPGLEDVWSDGTRVVATDGRLLIEVKGKFDVEENAEFPIEAVDKNLRVSINVKPVSVSTADLWRIGRAANQLPWEGKEVRNIDLYVDAKGNVAGEATNLEGDSAGYNDIKGKTLIGSINPDQLIDLATFARKQGEDQIKVGSGVTGDSANNVLVVEGKDWRAIATKVEASKPTAEVAPSESAPPESEAGPGTAQGSVQGAPLSPVQPVLAPNGTPIEKPIKGQRQIIADLARAMKVPIRFGRMIGNKYGGYFQPWADLIRNRRANDVVVTTHEIGHKWDKDFGFSRDPSISAELDALGDPSVYGTHSSWTPSKSRAYKLGEGVAEFMRYWLTSTGDPAKWAPNTHRLFQTILDSNRDVGDAFRQAKQDIQDWKTANPAQRLRSHISSGTNPNNTPYAFDQLMRDLVDDLHFARLAMDDARRHSGENLLPSQDIYLLARNLRGSYGMADTFVRHGPVDFNTKRVAMGESLMDALKPVSGNLVEFRDYMVARRAKELISQNRETGLLRTDVDAVLAQHQGNAVFRAAFDKVVDWNRRLLLYAVDAGLIRQEDFNHMVLMNKDYVPFHRIFEIGANEPPSQTGGGTGRGMNVGKPSSLRGLKGSPRNIVDPLESMIRNAYAIITASEKAAIHRALAGLAGKPNMGKWISDIGQPKQKISFDVSKIREQLEDAGADMTNVPDELLLSFYQKAGQAPFGENIIKVVVNGEPKMFQLKSELFDTFHALDVEDSSKLIRFLAVPANVLRAGVTMAPDFALANAIRDAFSSAIISKHGLFPFEATIRGVAAMIRDPKIVAEWQAAGGKNSIESMYFDRRELQQFLRERVSKDLTPAERALVWMKSPLLAMRLLTEKAEEATRIGEYEKAFNDYTKGGMTEGQARRLAAFESRDRQDFAKGGAKTKIVRHLAAFWNAGLQANVRLVEAFGPTAGRGAPGRTWKANTTRTILKGLAFITIPKLMEQALNWDDPDYWDRPQWERDLFFMIPIGKDDTGHTRFLRIPTPFEPGIIFGTLPGRMLQQYKQGGGGKDLVKTVLANAVPNPLPQTVQVLYGDFLSGPSGWDAYRNKPVVSSSLADRPADIQFSEQTSLTAKKAGAALGFSPQKIDHIIAGLTGGLGRQATAQILDRSISTMTGDPITSQMGMPGSRFLSVPATSASEAISQFYDKLKLMRAENERQKLGGKPKVDLRDLPRYERLATQISALNKVAKTATDPDKRQEAKERILKLAREVAQPR